MKSKVYLINISKHLAIFKNEFYKDIFMSLIITIYVINRKYVGTGHVYE